MDATIAVTTYNPHPDRRSYTITIEYNDGTVERLTGYAKLATIRKRFHSICRRPDVWTTAREISWRINDEDR